MLFGAALLDDQGKMVGSVLLCEFASRDELNQWLNEEPYVNGDVWRKIEIQECKVGPSFTGLRPSALASKPSNAEENMWDEN
jgi:hypothetical protein